MSFFTNNKIPNSVKFTEFSLDKLSLSFGIIYPKNRIRRTSSGPLRRILKLFLLQKIIQLFIMQ